jgi:hypothetical protein
MCRELFIEVSVPPQEGERLFICVIVVTIFFLSTFNFIYLHFLLSLAKLLGTLIRFLYRLTKQLRIENKIVTMERSSNKMKNKKIPQYQNIYKRQ